MRLHRQDKQALSIIGIAAMVGHLVLAAICGGPAGVIQQVTAADGAYVIICSPAGNQRIALADYLAGARTGEPVQTGAGGTNYCAHCAMGHSFALGALALLLIGIGWPTERTRRGSVRVSLLKTLRAVSVRGPPTCLRVI